MYDENLIILIPKEIKAKIKKKAIENCQTVSDYVRSLIIKDLKGNE